MEAPPSYADSLEHRYASALATVLRSSAIPYGYTVTVWTSGMMLARHRGFPSTGQVFLFAVGAVAAFALLGSIVRLGHGIPFDPRHGVLRRTGMVQLVAVAGALGAVTLVALIHSGIDWPLGAFVATSTYLALATLELAVVERR
jgi:hypothetical protein